MNRLLHSTSSLLGTILLVAGCGATVATPTREVLVATGGPPVLTSSERVARESQGQPPGGVVRAAFEQPLSEPLPLRPLEVWTEQEAAADALGRIGAAAVPELVRALDSPDAAVRRRAAAVLARMGPEAAEAAPHLTRLLADPDAAVRKAAARALGQIGPAAKDAIPSLMRTLQQPT